MNSPQGFNTLGISSLWVGISLPGLKETFQWRPWWEILRCLELGKSGDFAVTALLTQFESGWRCKYWAKYLQILCKILANIGQIFGKYWANFWPILGNIGQILRNIGQHFGQYWANIGQKRRLCCDSTSDSNSNYYMFVYQGPLTHGFKTDSRWNCW